MLVYGNECTNLYNSTGVLGKTLVTVGGVELMLWVGFGVLLVVVVIAAITSIIYYTFKKSIETFIAPETWGVLQ